MNYSILNLIDNMQGAGYPADSIVATIRCQIEADLRDEDGYNDQQEDAQRSRIASAVAACGGVGPFGEQAA